MKKIEIFDPAMCCPMGLCGTNINPELMRIAVVIETLKRQGITVIRHNLRDGASDICKQSDRKQLSSKTWCGSITHHPGGW